MLRQTFQQKLLQKLSPAQIQLMKLLQLPITSLEQRIKEEMEINPALEDSSEEEIKEEKEEDDLSDEERQEQEEKEEGADDEKAAKEELSPEDYLDDDDDIAYYKLQVNNKGKDEEKEMPMASSVSFQETLFSQLENLELSEQERIIAEYLLGCIDEDGYLRRDLVSVVDDMAFSQSITTTTEELESVLRLIKDEFEPVGIGAKDLQECLKLQIERKKWTETRDFALKIIEQQMGEFSKKHYKKIATHFLIEENDPKLKSALDEILKLNPRPGGSAKDSQRSNVLSIIPDFMLYNNNGTLEISLNSRNAPDLRVAGVYKQMLTEYSQRKDKTGLEAVQFVKQKIEGAKSFINNIKERQNTLYNIMNCILEYQKEYFLTGDELLLKPMILKDISDRIKMDISTVSRVTSTKYVQTNFGTILLKSLFNEAIATEAGEDISSKKIKKIISDAIEAEDKHKPLTDEAIMKILNDQSYVIARRTVAKYREMLDIPVARMRKKL